MYITIHITMRLLLHQAHEHINSTAFTLKNYVQDYHTCCPHQDGIRAKQTEVHNVHVELSQHIKEQDRSFT